MIIAKRPCSFEGKEFFIGDQIPDDYVLDPEAMEKMGIVSVVGDKDSATTEDVGSVVAEVFFRVPIKKGERTLEIDVSEAQFAETVQTMQMTTKDATAHIKGDVEDNTVLILLNALDSRTSVKKEAESKALILAEMEESAGDV